MKQPTTKLLKTVSIHINVWTTDCLFTWISMDVWYSDTVECHQNYIEFEENKIQIIKNPPGTMDGWMRHGTEFWYLSRMKAKQSPPTNQIEIHFSGRQIYRLEMSPLKNDECRHLEWIDEVKVFVGSCFAFYLFSLFHNIYK